MKTKEEITESGIPTCPDCGHTLADGENEDSFLCGCCDELVPLGIAKVIPRMKPEIEKWRVGPRSSAPPMYHTTAEDGFNGMFRPVIAGRQLRIIASDGEGWQHVSVSIEGVQQPPPWHIMCAVKDLFWDDEDWVCQFHPAKSEYVNHHPGCLHLWKPVSREMPTPPSILVGPK